MAKKSNQNPPLTRQRSILVLRRLWKYLSRFKWLLILAVILNAGSNGLALIGPKLSGAAIDAIKPGVGAVDFPSVFRYCGLMLVFYVISSALSYLLAALMVHLSRSTVYEMRKDIFDHLMKLPVSFYDTHSVGDILSVLSYDIDNINASLSNDLVQIFTSILTVSISFGMMLSISPKKSSPLY